MTPGTIKHISTCHPILIEKFIQLRKNCQEHTEFTAVYDLLCTCGWRDPKAQQIAFDTGKSKAKPGYSYHEYWLAFDVAPMGRNTKQIAWEDAKAWDIIHNASIGLGLEWGGNWKTIKDFPHSQLSIATIEEIRNQWLFTNNLLSDMDRKRLFFSWVTDKYLKTII